MARLLQNRAIEGRALVGLGDNFYYKEEWQNAYDAYERSLQLRRALGDSAATGVSLSGLGSLSIMLGRFDRAESQLREALLINIDLQDSYNQVNQTLNLGSLYLAKLTLNQAEAQYLQALELSQAQSDTHGEALSYQGLAEVALHRQDYDRARHFLERGEALGSTLEPLRAEFQCYKAALAYKKRDAQGALALILEAKSLKSEGNWSENLQTYLDIYQATLRTGIFVPLPYESNPLQGPYR